MTLPNFIVFGTRKAGTTSIYHYLEQHPQIFMSHLKGTRFFHFDPANPNRGAGLPVKSLEEYERYFAGASAKGAVAIGEASPTYMYDSGAAERMRDLLPDVRLIASLRHPVDRAYSEYLMHARINGNGASLSNPSKEELLRHLSAGLYAEPLTRYFELFGPDQILVLVFEEWIKDVHSMLQQTFRFLGVNDSFKANLSLQYNKGGVPKSKLMNSVLKHRRAFVQLKPYVPPQIRSVINKVRNANMAKPPALPPEMKSEIAGYFRDDIEKLEELLQRDLAVWRRTSETF